MCAQNGHERHVFKSLGLMFLCYVTILTHNYNLVFNALQPLRRSLYITLDNVTGATACKKPV